MAAMGDPVSAKRDHILHQYELHLDERNDEFETLDRKAREVIGLASIVTAIIGGFSLNSPNPTLEQRQFVAVIFAIYVIASLLAFGALYPRRWAIPGFDSADEAQKRLKQNPDDYFIWIIRCYALALANNKRVLRGKHRLTRMAIAAIVLDIVLTVALSLRMWL